MHVYEEVPQSSRLQTSNNRKLSVSSLKKESLSLQASNIIMTNPSTGVYEQVDLDHPAEPTNAQKTRKFSEPLPKLPDEQVHVPPHASDYLIPTHNDLIPNPTYGIAPPGVGPILNLDLPAAGDHVDQQRLQPGDEREGENSKSGTGDYAVINIK